MCLLFIRYRFKLFKALNKYIDRCLDGRVCLLRLVDRCLDGRVCLLRLVDRKRLKGIWGKHLTVLDAHSEILNWFFSTDISQVKCLPQIPFNLFLSTSLNKQTRPSRHLSTSLNKQTRPSRHLSTSLNKQTQPSRYLSTSLNKQTRSSRHLSTSLNKQTRPSRP
jgi:hypothetical protein